MKNRKLDSKQKSKKLLSPRSSDAKTSSQLPVLVDSRIPSVPAQDQDILSLYLKEVSKVPLLTPEQEHELAIQAFDHQNADAQKKLIQANLRFVLKMAFEYARYGARVLDLVQEGNLGLMKAVRDFNPHRDVRLTTYAVWWIRSYIQDFLLRNWSIVRVGTTAAQKKLFYRLKKEQEKFERQGIRPEPKQIAMAMGVEEDDVKLMQQRMSAPDVSLTPLEPDDSTPRFVSQVPDTNLLAPDALDRSEQATLFDKALKEFVLTLNERDQNILQDRLLSEAPKTLLEIGEAYGITKERARQLEERIKEKLKEFLAKNYPDISLR
jgi:RNA polymerase sigma-32 factor